MIADVTGNKVEGVSDNDRKNNNPSLLKIRARRKYIKKRKKKQTKKLGTQKPIPPEYKTLR